MSAPADAKTLPKAVIAHRLPGRARLRIAGRHGDAAWFAAAGAALAAIEDVEQVEARPTTASLLIRHHGKLEPILSAAAGESLFKVDRFARPWDAAPPEAPVLGTNEMLATGALAFALVQALRGQILGPASALLWTAMQLLGVPEPRRNDD